MTPKKRSVQNNSTNSLYSKWKEIVTIEIPGGEKFCVHAALLAYFSDYFRAALNCTWEEAETLHFRFTECADQTSMQVFISWLHEAYHKHLADYLRVFDLQDFLVEVIEDWFTEGISWKNENEEGDYFEDFRAFIIALLEDDTVTH
ncbi:hypothetical protein DL766_005806 [Monosporascus sp. MC13-8B]|uniref:BTB domain-containing protein n=1 Tax=Monosporascus cannonballus TaxID=155416 RepID=A0ABY0HKT9_9PEZI|nr:hypothetical protein DL763_006943 [Monosporascus cannonballus]RYO94896.1 hypothetical protein DL762_000330 [Monosporascus cannonballus]RYP28583.1 hypothetical protein DL766_005806 [Monosporascus sp. MC13-8B]